MISVTRSLQPVAIEDLPEYPISVEDRLDSHFFIQWNLKRWRTSVFRKLAEPEVGWFGFLLFCESHDETPVGTLPTDERLLASALGITIDRWRQLCQREIGPLHNWTRVRAGSGLDGVIRSAAIFGECPFTNGSYAEIASAMART